jgi:hypothetical protein
MLSAVLSQPASAEQGWTRAGAFAAPSDSPSTGDEFESGPPNTSQLLPIDGNNGVFDPAPAAPYASGLHGPAARHNQRQLPHGYRFDPNWQFLPEGLMYKSYLAGPQEPRFASAWLHEKDSGWFWDVSLGARQGIFRYGTPSSTKPEGWQLDIEGAAFPRLNMDQQEDLEAVNFRFGIPLTWAHGPWQMKVGYYHISAHVGDEYIEKHPTFQRVNYVRDSAIFGLGYFVTRDTRLYGEVARAFHYDVADPLEFQFGFEYSPAIATGTRGIPFVAASVQLLEEHDFGGAFNTMAGWQWRSGRSNRLLRFGLQYFNGKSSQFAFFDEHEELLGLGLWLDQ